MGLRKRAEAAELEIQQALGTRGESDVIVQVIEREARAFAELALRKYIAGTFEPLTEGTIAEAVAAAEGEE